MLTYIQILQPIKARNYGHNCSDNLFRSQFFLDQCVPFGHCCFKAKLNPHIRQNKTIKSIIRYIIHIRICMLIWKFKLHKHPAVNALFTCGGTPLYWALRQVHCPAQLNEWIYRDVYMERLALIGLILWIKCLHCPFALRTLCDDRHTPV